MLISFSVQNCLSFHDSQSLAYTTTADRTLQSSHCIKTGYHAIPRLNRSVVLFGAGGSGKTNVFLSLRALRNMMRDSFSYTEANFAAQYAPFRFDRSDAQPTRFVIDLLLDSVRYRYSLAFDAQRITYEQLLVNRGPKSQRWFERAFDADTQLESWAPFSPSLVGAREMWRKSTRCRVPFIVAAAKLNAEQFAPRLQWFDSHIDFVLELADPLEFEALIARLRDTQFKAVVLDILRHVGVPVRDIRLVPRGHAAEFSASQPISLTSRPPYSTGSAAVELQYTHLGEQPVWMPLAGEAAGTQRLLSLLRPLLDSTASDRLVVIDNFDAALHPLVTRFLLQMINALPSAAHPPQLMLSSHNTALMDLSILRRDEIWLVDLDDTYASRLSCLASHGPRKSEPVGKHYLLGRYGAIPEIESVRSQSFKLPADASAARVSAHPPSVRSRTDNRGSKHP